MMQVFDPEGSAEARAALEEVVRDMAAAIEEFCGGRVGPTGILP